MAPLVHPTDGGKGVRPLKVVSWHHNACLPPFQHVSWYYMPAQCRVYSTTSPCCCFFVNLMIPTYLTHYHSVLGKLDPFHECICSSPAADHNEIFFLWRSSHGNHLACILILISFPLPSHFYHLSWRTKLQEEGPSRWSYTVFMHCARLATS